MRYKSSNIFSSEFPPQTPSRPRADTSYVITHDSANKSYPFPDHRTYIPEKYQEAEQELFRPIFRLALRGENIDNLLARIPSDPGKEKLVKYLAKSFANKDLSFDVSVAKSDSYADKEQIKQSLETLGKGVSRILENKEIGDDLSREIGKFRSDKLSESQKRETRSYVSFDDQKVYYSDVLELNKFIKECKNKNIKLSDKLSEDLVDFYNNALNKNVPNFSGNTSFFQSAKSSWGRNISNSQILSSSLSLTAIGATLSSSVNQSNILRESIFSNPSQQERLKTFEQTRESVQSANIRVRNPLFMGFKELKMILQKQNPNILEKIDLVKDQKYVITQDKVNDLIERIGNEIDSTLDTRINDYIDKKYRAQDVRNLESLLGATLGMSNTEIFSPASSSRDGLSPWSSVSRDLSLGGLGEFRAKDFSSRGSSPKSPSQINYADQSPSPQIPPQQTPRKQDLLSQKSLIENFFGQGFDQQRELPAGSARKFRTDGRGQFRDVRPLSDQASGDLVWSNKVLNKTLGGGGQNYDNLYKQEVPRIPPRPTPMPTNPSGFNVEDKRVVRFK